MYGLHVVEEGELTISGETFDPKESEATMILAAAVYDTRNWGPANENDPNFEKQTKSFKKVSISLSLCLT